MKNYTWINDIFNIKYSGWLLLGLVILFLNTEKLHAQSLDDDREKKVLNCAFDDMHQKLMQSNPDYKINYQQEDKDRIEYLRSGLTPRSAVVYKMPCVVHIFHGGEAMGSTANPSDQTIEQIVVEASQRFRHAHNGAGSYTNPFYGIDSEIELCLAKEDADGNYTTGVTRHYRPDLAVGDYNVVAAGMDSFSWDKTRYVNLFVMTTMTNASGVYVGGYDFTIYTSAAFWSGLIAHELGHYYSLAHTFSGACPNNDCLANGDGVCDTPPKASSGFTGSCGGTANSCTTDDDDTSSNNPYRPTANGGMGDQPDMLENYMDYTGSCWDTYTQGQVDRMRFNISNSRLSIAGNDTVCDPQPIPDYEIALNALSDDRTDDCGPFLKTTFELENLGQNTINTLDLQIFIDDIFHSTISWNGNIGPGITSTYTLVDTTVIFTVGNHLISLIAENPNGQVDANIYNNQGFYPLTYYGGDYCQTFSACQIFNTNTASGSGNFTIVEVAGAYSSVPNGVVSYYICVTTTGDVSYSGEVFDIIGEDNLIYGQTNSGVDCQGYTDPFCFTIDSTTFINWSQDDTITITLDPDSTFINPSLCLTNQACVDIILPIENDSIIYGCTFPNSHNYNPTANVDDGSCESCADGVLNGDETGIDCGGSLCDACVPLDSCDLELLTSFGYNGAGDISIGVATNGNKIFITRYFGDQVKVIDLDGNDLFTFGSSGSGNGQFNFNSPQGIEYRNNGVLYIADDGNDRIQRFDTLGNYIDQFTHSSMDGPRGLHISETSNRCYVVSRNSSRLTVFDLNGSYIFNQLVSGFGTIEDCTEYKNKIYVVTDNSNVVIYDINGAYLNHINIGGGALLNISILADNKMVVADNNASTRVFKTDGTFLYALPFSRYPMTAHENKLFCIESSAVEIYSNCGLDGFPGCTDINAHNYNPMAEIDDGTCETCDDGILNGDETGIDCGGILCDPCTVMGADCPTILNLNGVTIIDGRYKADQLLISNNVLQGIGFALYESGVRIELNSNFEIKLGVEFEARIKNCIPE